VGGVLPLVFLVGVFGDCCFVGGGGGSTSISTVGVGFGESSFGSCCGVSVAIGDGIGAGFFVCELTFGFLCSFLYCSRSGVVLW